jgi:hypothetical protein
VPTVLAILTVGDPADDATIRAAVTAAGVPALPRERCALRDIFCAACAIAINALLLAVFAVAGVVLCHWPDGRDDDDVRQRQGARYSDCTRATIWFATNGAWARSLRSGGSCRRHSWRGCAEPLSSSDAP